MQIPNVFKNKVVQMTSVAITAFVGGYLLGYKHKKRPLIYRFTPDPERMQRFVPYSVENIVDADFGVKPETIADVILKQNDPELERLLDEEDRIAQREKERVLAETTNTQPEPEPVRIIALDDQEWDMDAEVAARNPDEPYILHVDEFVNEEMDFDQETLEYYAGDDIITDTDSTPIYNYRGLIGELKFGHGSKDPNVVYIRNEKIHREWEVLLNPGSYAEEVMGLRAEVPDNEHFRHSHEVPKFRQE